MKRLGRFLKTANGCFKALTKRPSKLMRPYLPDVEKKVALERVLPKISTLVFGSSHAHFGWYAEGDEFNCANSSCDLYHACELYKRILAMGAPCVRRVVLFYSVFSPGFLLEKTSAGSFAISYRHLWGIPYQARLQPVARIIEWKVKNLLLAAQASADDGYLGNNEYLVKKNSKPIDVGKRVAGHLRHCRRPVSQNGFVAEMACLAASCGHEFVVVIPPVRQDYAAFLPVDHMSLFSGLTAMAEKHRFRVLDYTRNVAFGAADFMDYDHLSKAGARKLSGLVRSSL